MSQSSRGSFIKQQIYSMNSQTDCVTVQNWFPPVRRIGGSWSRERRVGGGGLEYLSLVVGGGGRGVLFK